MAAVVESFLAVRTTTTELVSVAVEINVTDVDLVVATPSIPPGPTQIASLLAEQLGTTVQVPSGGGVRGQTSAGDRPVTARWTSKVPGARLSRDGSAE